MAATGGEEVGGDIDIDTDTDTDGVLVYVTDVAYSGEFVGEEWCVQVQVIGRRRDGRSVVVRVQGLCPYFYCNRVARASADADARCMSDSLGAFLAHTADEVEERANAMGQGWQARSAQMRAERIRATGVRVSCVRRTPLVEFQLARDLFRVECTHPHVIAAMRDAVVRKQVEPQLTCDESGNCQAYEANVEYVLRFMVDTGVRCHAWVRVSAAAAEVCNTSYCSSPDLLCSSPGMLHVVSDDEESALRLVPSLKLLSFDIECAAPPHTFPDAARDPVIQIACDWTTLDERPSAVVESTSRATLLALRATDASVVAKGGADAAVTTRCFETEADLLYAFAALVRTEDPDVITSWNGPKFDWKYIVERADALRLHGAATTFSRLHNVRTRNRLVQKTTKAFGHEEINQVDIPGRFVFDMLGPVQVNYKLRSYQLGEVAHSFIGERKDDVHHTEITEMWNGTPQTRGTLGKYCVQDARLPRRLLMHTLLLQQYLEVARVCGVPSSYLTTKGQQIKVFTMMLRDARCNGFVIPYTPSVRQTAPSAADALRQEASYIGATVLEPDRGFYTTPVVALDFASLYPSIMIELNLSHDTHVPGRTLPSAARAAAEAAGLAPPAWVDSLTDDDCVVTQSGEIFVKTSVRKGVLPRILATVLAARKAARAKIATLGADEKHIKVALNCRQLALKVSANSVYGFTGVLHGKLPCLAIAITVTARGRDMIETTKRVVIEYYEREFAPTHGGHARVIYGDTDSVLVLFPCSVPLDADGKLTDVSAAVAEAFTFAVACSKAAAAVFPKPHDLEVEKAYLPYLLVSKKRYAGGLFTFDKDKPPGNAPEKVSASGLEMVRRDNANMAPRQIQAVLDALVYDLAPDRAIGYAQDAALAIIHGPVPAVAIAEGCAAAACDVLAAIGKHTGERFRAVFLPAAIEALGQTESTAAAAAAGVDDARVIWDGVLQLSPHAAEKKWHAAARVALAHAAAPVDAETEAAVLEAVSRTLRLNVTFGDFVISKKYTQNFADYKAKLPHIEMLKRMAKRAATTNSSGEPIDAYAGQFRRYLGDRIDYIVAAPNIVHQGTRIIDRSEDPGWAQLNGIYPDPVYYLRQLLGPLARILKALVGTKRAAFSRIMAHARTLESGAFSRKRFAPKECLAIWGVYASGRTKSLAAIAKTARAKRAKAEAAAAARGDAPPEKLPRVTGPLDAFFTTVTAPKNAERS